MSNDIDDKKEVIFDTATEANGEKFTPDISKKCKSKKRCSCGGKIIKLLILLLLIAGFGYMGIWNYYASDVKAEITEAFAKVKELASPDGEVLKLSYGEVEVTGFPMEFNVGVSDVKFNIDFSNVPNAGKSSPFTSFNFSFTDKVELKAEVFGKTFKLHMPELYNFSFGAPNGNNNMSIAYNSPPTIELELAKSPMDLLLEFGDPYAWKDDRILDYFRKFIYNDTGSKVIDIENNQLLMSSDGTILKFSNTPIAGDTKEIIQILVKVANASVSDKYYDILTESMSEMSQEEQAVIEYIIEEYKKSGDVSFNFDVTFTGDAEGVAGSAIAQGSIPEFNVAIKQIALVNELYAFNSDGEITADASDSMPYGWYRINIANYQKLIDFYVGIFNKAIIPEMKRKMEMAAKTGEGLPIPMPIMKIEKKHTTILNRIFKELGIITEDGKDILLVVGREKGGEAYIGKLSLMEAAMIAQKGFMEMMMPPSGIPTEIAPK